MKEWNQSKEENILGFHAFSPLLQGACWKMKRTVRSPANYSKVSESIINVCSTFIYRISGKWILSSWAQESKCRKKPSPLEQNFWRFSVTIARLCVPVTTGLLCCQQLKKLKMLWSGHAQKCLFSAWQEKICLTHCRKSALPWVLWKNEPDHWNSCETVN